MKASEKERTSAIQRILDESFPDARTALSYSDPLELLVATILSAQCTDERVNKVTATLFKKYRSAQDYLKTPQEELEKDIHSTGFFRNKAKSIRGTAARLISDFNAEVPGTMEELLTLPGVARKTANCVLAGAFGVAGGITVDTHVIRVSQRLGLTKEADAIRIEQDLMRSIPREKWIAFSHQIILLGRSFCNARKPSHRDCPLQELCPSRDS